MKNLLVTAFEPFGGEKINASWEAVRRLPETLGVWRLHRRALPVVFAVATVAAIQAAEDCAADAVVCVGQAAGRSAVTPELVAINWQAARMADNAGKQPWDLPILPEGPAAYFSTLPVRAMEEAIKARGLPASLSYSAGSFVCNDLYYRLRHHFDGTGVGVCFVHVPQTPEQGRPSLPSEQAAEALVAAILAI